MGSFRTRTSNGFSANLLSKLELEFATTPAVFDPNHDPNDTVYFLVWLPHHHVELIRLCHPAQVMDLLNEIAALPVRERCLKVAAQVALETAHRLQDRTCTCWELPDGRGEVCPVCQQLADGMEIPY